MRCINNLQTDIWFNLAAEEYLLKEGEGDYFMLWQSDPAVVVGKHQDVYREIDPDYTARQGIRVARRYTGGGTVYHDGGNLNLTFVETAGLADFDKYNAWIMEALSPFGLPLRTDARRGIYIRNRKISGSAQCIWKDRVMYHATLLFDADLEKLEASLHPPVMPEAEEGDRNRIRVASVKSPVTNIADHLPHPLRRADFRQYLADYFLHREEGRSVYTWTEADLQKISRLQTQKYMQPEWNYQALSGNRAAGCTIITNNSTGYVKI